jgi:hypothetical protein
LQLLGFHRHQYSDYRADNISGARAWFSAAALKLIDPPMKLETTMQSVKVHHYSNLHILDVTDFMVIGGPFSTLLRGPIPSNLLPPAGVAVVGMNGGPPAPPLPNFQLPRYTKPSMNSANPNNWRT